VTRSDFEWLAREAAGTRIARVNCLPNINREFAWEPGWVTLMIVPQDIEGRLVPSVELIEVVNEYITSRASAVNSGGMPTRINVTGPGYIEVTVKADVVVKNLRDGPQVRQKVMDALKKFLHPLSGGPDATGWVLGRNVFASEIYRVFKEVPGVDHLKSLQLIPSQAQHQIEFASEFVCSEGLAEGSSIVTTDGKKALVAEPVGAGVSSRSLMIKGFKAGDRITNVAHLTVQPRPKASSNQCSVTVTPLDAVDLFPPGSVVITSDSRQSTRLSEAFTSNAKEIAFEDKSFVNLLKPYDVLTVFYPFPMTITFVASNNETLTLGIESYETAIAFSPGARFATLEDKINLPLYTKIDANTPVTSITLSNFKKSDHVIIPGSSQNSISINVTPITDVVYLGNYLLVCSGRHLVKVSVDAS
jgi:hypothetical protein